MDFLNKYVITFIYMTMPTYNQGKYAPSRPDKYVGDVKDIVYRSMWELKFMRWCDKNPAVIAWTSEYPIPYLNQLDGRVHRYFVDFFVKMKDAQGKEHVLMVEVKPDVQTRPPNKPKNANPKSMKRYMTECETFQINTDKWKAADEFAKKNNMRFVIFNEYDLGIAKRGK